MQLLKWIKSLFAGRSYQGRLEQFVASKSPTSAADVEHWVREWQHSQSSWGQGL